LSTDQFKSLDDGFGHWFAGFVDGEGCFQILGKNGRGFVGYGCTFVISCRRDDIGTLQEIQRRTGLGVVRLIRATKSRKKSLNAKPECKWQVFRKAECAELVRIFDAYPLRAKKRRDYVIWREAVIEHNRVHRQSGRHGISDWSRMEELYYAIRETRRYVEPTLSGLTETSVESREEDRKQLELAAA
jgi:hypothetical protein